MTLTSFELTQKLELFEFAPGKKASWETLKTILTDIEYALFFAKAYKMSPENVALLLKRLFNTSVIDALTNGEHSTELQDYIVTIVPEDVLHMVQRVDFVPTQHKSEVLAQLWEQVETTVAKSIQEVADKLGTVLDALPGMEGQMTFRTLAKLNRQRPTIGSYEALIQHPHSGKNLVILDVSGSMTETTIRTIVEDVVALSYKAKAQLAIVSNNTYTWEPGTYSVQDVLNAAEYGGTHYESLIPLLNEDWATVVTIADYDSSRSAQQAIKHRATGSVEQVLDISLVNRPTFLAECVGQLAQDVKPILIGDSYRVL